MNCLSIIRECLKSRKFRNLVKEIKLKLILYNLMKNDYFFQLELPRITDKAAIILTNPSGIDVIGGF